MYRWFSRPVCALQAVSLLLHSDTLASTPPPHPLLIFFPRLVICVITPSPSILLTLHPSPPTIPPRRF